jgi:hypothetical protein
VSACRGFETLDALTRSARAERVKHKVKKVCRRSAHGSSRSDRGAPSSTHIFASSRNDVDQLALSSGQPKTSTRGATDWSYEGPNIAVVAHDEEGKIGVDRRFGYDDIDHPLWMYDREEQGILWYELDTIGNVRRLRGGPWWQASSTTQPISAATSTPRSEGSCRRTRERRRRSGIRMTSRDF